MALIELRKLILQTRMRIHPVGLDDWFLVGPFVYFRTLCVRAAMALARLRGLAWALAGRLCDKYHNLMNWLIFWECQYFIIRSDVDAENISFIIVFPTNMDFVW